MVKRLLSIARILSRHVRLSKGDEIIENQPFKNFHPEKPEESKNSISRTIVLAVDGS